jgi:Cdc6-like AAA superfamily ATPase
MTLKYNPFKPNNIVHPAMFVGRVDELRAVERCLFQAKNGNPQHFLIQGERGIGKSSLITYIEAIGEGRIQGVQGNRFNFLTVSIDVGGCGSQLEIIGKIGRGLRSAIAPKQILKEKAKGFSIIRRTKELILSRPLRSWSKTSHDFAQKPPIWMACLF